MAVIRTEKSNRKNPSQGKAIRSKSGPIGRNSPGRVTTIKLTTAPKGKAGATSSSDG